MLPDAAALRSVRLRATPPAATPAPTTAAPSSRASAASGLSSVSQEAYLNQRLREVDLEAWYPTLSAWTFPAVFVPLTPEEARALVARYRAQWHARAPAAVGDEPDPVLASLMQRIAAAAALLGRDSDRDPDAASDPPIPLDNPLAPPPRPSTNVDDGDGATPTIMPGAGVEATEIREESRFPTVGVFAKLSSRSPKDARSRQPIAHRLCEARLREAGIVPSPARAVAGDAVVSGSAAPVMPMDATARGNAIADAVFYGAKECLKLHTPRDVVDTLASSERVCEDDIPLALSFPEAWSQHIVLRPWIDMPTHTEFRVFVIGNQLTAMCQYFTGVCYPDAIVASKHDIEALVRGWFAMHIRDKAPIASGCYAMDLCVDITTRSVLIIEFNPFDAPDGMGTGTVLFDVDSAVDRQILFGEAPFEFRVVDTPVPQVTRRIKGEWRDVLVSKGYLP